MLALDRKSLFLYGGIILFVLLLLVFWPNSASRETAQIKPLDIQTWQTKNGVKVLYVYAPEIPMVDIEVIFDAGSTRDGQQPGLANLTNGMLSHGAGKWDVNQIAERFDDVGAQFSADTSKDYAGLHLRSLIDADWLNPAVATLQAIVSQPVFDEAELERVRKQYMISFKARQESPETIADELFYKTMYGSHPYALPTIGTEASIKQISRQDLQNFYQRYYVANNALITLVGAVPRQQAQQLAEQIVGKLAAGEKAPALPEVQPLANAVQVHQEHPSTQTHILIGEPGSYRNDPDYFVLYLGNHILGGSGFGSRIMTEIREKRGLAYSSYSYFNPLKQPGPFTIGIQTSNGKTAEALKLARETLRQFIAEGPTEQELQHAKKNITGGFALRIDSNRDISNYLGVIGFYGLPLNYLSEFNKKIEAISAQQIRETFQRRLDPDKMITVTVGQQATPDKS